MSEQQYQYLQEMGIQTWVLSHPERMNGYHPEKSELTSECRLLLVAPVHPTDREARLFEKVLKSFNVSLKQAQHVTPENLPLVETRGLEWVWFAGCAPVEHSAKKMLRTPNLEQIEGNNDERRALWQQICAYGDPR